jgi:hypothetical protein
MRTLFRNDFWVWLDTGLIVALVYLLAAIIGAFGSNISDWLKNKFQPAEDAEEHNDK